MEPKIINGGIAVDDRGSLRFVNEFDFAGVKRFYCVENSGPARQVRAWHGHKKEGKYVYVARGSIVVGVVNLDTEQVILRTVLSDASPKVLYIPPNHANGFMNLTENAIVFFFSTSTLDESRGDDIRFPYDKWNIWAVEPR